MWCHFDRQLTEKDQELYQNFPLVISERWQAEVAETVFDTINQEADKIEAKRKNKHRKFDVDEKGLLCSARQVNLRRENQ